MGEQGGCPVQAALFRAAARARRRRCPEVCRPERAAQLPNARRWVELAHALQRLREWASRHFGRDVAACLA
eukprot:1079883-Pleurochrysis_carterae.AAC.1